MLETRGLGAAIDGARVLSDVTVAATGGEVLGIIGPNGAGKSTLLRTMAGLLPAAAGEVRVNAEPLDELSPRSRAARIAYVAQDSQIAADFSVRELVRLGRYAHRRRLSPLSEDDAIAAERALASVGIDGLADRPVPSLSGGERQLAQLARAVAQGAGAILLDEPTSALDVHHQLRVFALLRRLAADGTAIVVVLHDLNDAARYCDRIAVIAGGGLRIAGTPHEVLTPRLLAEVYRIEARVHTDEFGFPHVHPLAALEAAPSHTAVVPSAPVLRTP